jgi:copper chaperone CopZ
MSVTTTYVVKGMTCGHCVDAVTGEIEALDGVRDVRVELSAGTVAVTSDDALSLDAVRAAVDEAGYVLAGTDG